MCTLNAPSKAAVQANRIACARGGTSGNAPELGHLAVQRRLPALEARPRAAARARLLAAHAKPAAAALLSTDTAYHVPGAAPLACSTASTGAPGRFRLCWCPNTQHLFIAATFLPLRSAQA